MFFQMSKPISSLTQKVQNLQKAAYFMSVIFKFTTVLCNDPNFSEPEPENVDRAGHEVQQLWHGEHQPLEEGQRRGPGVQCVWPLCQDAWSPPAPQHEVRLVTDGDIIQSMQFVT